MSPHEREVLALTVQLEVALAQRDRESAGRIAAVAEVERLREDVVRLQAMLERLQVAAAARPGAEPGPARGLASLIRPPAEGRRGA